MSDETITNFYLFYLSPGQSLSRISLFITTSTLLKPARSLLPVPRFPRETAWHRGWGWARGRLLGQLASTLAPPPHQPSLSGHGAAHVAASARLTRAKLPPDTAGCPQRPSHAPRSTRELVPLSSRPQSTPQTHPRWMRVTRGQETRRSWGLDSRAPPATRTML